MNRSFALTFVLLAIASVVFGPSVSAGRWYGSFSLSAQKTRQSPSTIPATGLYSSQALVNVEDVLFYKNRLRLAANFDWRDDMYTSFHEYRPIYYADLSGYGYSWNTSYSPFTRQSAVAGDSTGTLTVDYRIRDLRSSIGVNVPKYPTVNIVYSRYRQYDTQPIRSRNQVQRSWVIETYFQRQLYSLRANYNRTRQDDLASGRNADISRAMSGTVSGLTPPSKIGSVSATYNYYDAKRSLPGAISERSKTHSVTAMASADYVKGVSVTTSYSGRFTGSTGRIQRQLDLRSETVSGQLAFEPARYLELQAVKAYQLDGRERQYEISEYVALSASVSRYIRRGVDTRMSLTRTIYQQSNRIIQFVDSLGDIDSTRRINHFTIDSWYGSINFRPVAYVRTVASYNVTRDNQPTSADRTYQSTGSFDARLAVSERIEARIAYTSSYQGERLRFGHAFSENWNMGGTWLPGNNINLAVTYTHASYNTTVKNTNGNVNVYLSYAYRKAYSFYVSYGQQQQTQRTVTGSSSGAAPVSSRPENWNTQLTIYTGKRSTLTLGYLKTLGSTVVGGDKRTSETYQAVFNFRI